MTLHKFEGREVIGTKAKIVKTGDGLSESVALDPVELGLGETVFLLVEATVTRVSFEPVKDTASLIRVPTLAANTVTLVDKEFAGARLEAQRVKIEQAKGVERLSFDDDGEGEADGSE
jgi:hypothetical protein